MMPELSLHVLDIAQNSIRAQATLVIIRVHANTADDHLTITVEDNGCGMSPEQVARVTDPFFTTRTTRKVGLGISFFKMAAEAAGGEFSIISQEGIGTTVTAGFQLSHIDRIPLGDMTATIHTLIMMNPDMDFVYDYQVDDRGFVLDTREMREILGDVPLNTPDVGAYIKEYLTENKKDTDGSTVL